MRFFQKMLVCVWPALMVTGCGHSKPYKIVSKNEDSIHMNLDVEISANSTKSEMELWSKELQTSFGTGKKIAQVFYYDIGAGTDAEHLIGVCINGKMQPPFNKEK